LGFQQLESVSENIYEVAATSNKTTGVDGRNTRLGLICHYLVRTYMAINESRNTIITFCQNCLTLIPVNSQIGLPKEHAIAINIDRQPNTFHTVESRMCDLIFALFFGHLSSDFFVA
jgi:hypothetical protein